MRTQILILACFGLVFPLIAAANASARSEVGEPGSLTAAPQIQLDIPKQPLGDSLRELATQAKINVVYDPPIVERYTAPAIQGPITTKEALDKLLKHTGLQYRFVTDKTVSIRLTSASSAHRSPEVSTSRLRGAGNAMRLAQSGAEPSDLNAVQAEDSASPAAQSDQNAMNKEPGIQEIVVTAQKREERLQDVPISITVLGGGNLDSSSFLNVTQALNSVPGIAISNDVNPTIRMRGVGAAREGAAGGTPVAYYIDSIPFSGITAAPIPRTEVYDLERIEVLRGPQGTLYGASALAGVVRVLTKDANPDAFELKARASTSSTDGGDGSYSGDMAINVPLVSGKVAARAVVGYQNQGGWIDRPNQNVENANDAETKNVRLKLNAQPTEQLSIGMSAWLMQSDYGASTRSGENYQFSRAAQEPFSNDLDVYGLKVGYDFAQFSIESMTSYLARDSLTTLDITAILSAAQPVPLLTTSSDDTLYEEFTLKSTHGGPWRWSTGAMYRDAEERTLLSDPLNIFLSGVHLRSESFAIFGEVTRIFVDGKVELTAGLRYFEDEVTQSEKLNATGAPLIDVTDKFDATSPRVALAWHPANDSTVYASYSEGFRSGFSQTPAIVRLAPQFPAVKPDNLKNYEIGAKGSLPGGRLSFETALYYVDWQDVQQQLGQVVAGAPRNVTINGVSASGIGFDFGVTARPIDNLALGASVSWSDLSWDDAVLTNNVVLFGKGERPNLSPEYTAGASLDYTIAFGQSGFEGVFSASANYVSEQDVRTARGSTVFIGDGDPIFTARTSFSVKAQDRWTAMVYIDNVTNEDGASVRDVWPDTQLLGGHIFERPRTIGLQLEYHY